MVPYRKSGLKSRLKNVSGVATLSVSGSLDLDGTGFCSAKPFERAFSAGDQIKDVGASFRSRIFARVRK